MRGKRTSALAACVAACVAVCAVVVLMVRALARPLPAKAMTSREVTGDEYAEIDAYVERQRQRLKIPGVALAIVAGERVVHLQGFGEAWPGGPPPGPHTPFAIGSLTKPFTALAVMQLVEAGKVELDAPVQRYLPWFRLADAEAARRMTVRNLLNQTSGLAQTEGIKPLADLDQGADAAERQARALAGVKPVRSVGSAFEYCNLNYNLLGLVVEAASGEEYAEYVRKHIFVPLDMNHSYTEEADARHNGEAAGHVYWFGWPLPAPRLAMPRGSLASGQLLASSEDMAHYLIAQLNGGRYAGTQVLSAAGMEEMHRGAVDVVELGMPLGSYGMGWFDHRDGPLRIVGHHGMVPEYEAYMAILPEQKQGVVLLTNAGHLMLKAELEALGMDVARLVAGHPPARQELGSALGAMRWLLAVPLLQVLGLALVRGRARRWLIIPNLALAGMAAWMAVSGLLPALLLFAPDAVVTVLVCGGIGMLWTGLTGFSGLKAWKGRRYERQRSGVAGGGRAGGAAGCAGHDRPGVVAAQDVCAAGGGCDGGAAAD